jgi:hypothetical protein
MAAKVSEALSWLSGAGVSPFELLLHLLDEGNDMYRPYRAELFKETNKRLFAILDLISGSKDGRKKLQEWLKSPAGTAVVGKAIHDEMDGLREEHHLKGVADISPEYIMDQQPATFADNAPFMISLLRAAAQSERQAAINTKKSPERVS